MMVLKVFSKLKALHGLYKPCLSLLHSGEKRMNSTVLSCCVSFGLPTVSFPYFTSCGEVSLPSPAFLHEMCTSDFLMFLILTIPCAYCYVKLVFQISLDKCNSTRYSAGSKLNELGRIITEGGSRLPLYCRALLSEWQILFCTVGERKQQEQLRIAPK